MPDILLTVPHHTQRQQADCLAACTAMILAYLGQQVDYSRLLNLVDVQGYGAPSSNIQRLTRLGVAVDFGPGTLAELQQQLLRSRPCIVFIRTGELSTWSEDTGHAVVLVGMTQDAVLLNDPAFVQAPQRIPMDEFMLAWLDFDYDYAVISFG